MFKPLSAFIGLRYIRARRRNQFLSFISVASMIGIALGVMILITVMSVMNGFILELRERILGMASHITVSGYEGEISDWQELSDIINNKNERVQGVAPYISSQGMLSFTQNVHGAMLRGIIPSEEPKVSTVGEHMLVGDLNQLIPGKFNIIIGKSLARALGVNVGEKVTVITPQAIATPAGMLPRLKRFTVVGVFEVGHNEYDSAMAFMHIQDAGRLFRMNGAVSGLRIKIDDLFDAPEVRQEISGILPGVYWLSDWTIRHKTFFRAVSIEKRMLFFILLLIILVAAFSILANLFMVVTDKQADIAILRTLGASPGNIMSIFIMQGTVIGIIGIVAGVAGGVSLALNVDVVVPFIENLLGVDFMPPDVYYISDFPSDLQKEDVVQITIWAFALTVAATLFPAWKAAQTQPAEALRYE